MLFASHQGWLDASLEIKRGKKTDRITRIDYLHPDSIYREMPDAGVGDYLARIWQKMGQATSGMNGAQPFSWQEIAAYCSLVDNLLAWEVEVLMAMSRNYCSLLHKSDPKTEPPYIPTDDAIALAIERGHQNEYQMRGTRNG